MTEIIDNTENNMIEYFNGGDFVFTKSGGEFVGGGYKINSIFLEDNIPIMTTYNKSVQTGEKVSCQFENLAVPAGLFYINTKVPKRDIDISSDISSDKYFNHKMAPDEMMDKLFSLIEFDKKRKRKTRKNNVKSNKRNTRKHK
jgi:hypothetical protein